MFCLSVKNVKIKFTVTAFFFEKREKNLHVVPNVQFSGQKGYSVKIEMYYN